MFRSIRRAKHQTESTWIWILELDVFLSIRRKRTGKNPGMDRQSDPLTQLNLQLKNKIMMGDFRCYYRSVFFPSQEPATTHSVVVQIAFPSAVIKGAVLLVILALSRRTTYF